VPTEVASVQDIVDLAVQIEALRVKVEALTPAELPEEVKAAAIVLLEWMLGEIQK
jgi:hypothetical protein